MKAIIIDAVLLIFSVIVAMLPTDDTILYWACWANVVGFVLFLIWDIYQYRCDRWCQ